MSRKFCTLSDVCYYVKDKIHTYSLTADNYISTENMIPNKGGIEKASSLPTVPYVSQYLKGDILISNIRPYFKKIWYATHDGGCSNDVLALRAKDVCLAEYLFYALSSDAFFEYAMQTAKGTKMPRGDKKAIMNYTISLPPLETQKKIAAVLSSLDDKIELNTRMNKVLEEIAQAIFKRWFVEFEFPNEKGEPYKSSGGKMKESELGLIPDGWGVKMLGNMCESVSKTHSFNKESLIFLNTGDIDNGCFNHANYSPTNEMPGQAKKSIKQQDILYSEIRPINRHFAFVNFDAQDYVVSTKLMVIRSKHINPRRLYQFLTSKEIINSLQKEAEARSGTFPQIRFENIKVLKMLIGNDSIESTYSHILDAIYNQIDRNTRENKVTEGIRDTLLPKLMNGEIEV